MSFRLGTLFERNFTVTFVDVEMFSRVSSDRNPIHIDIQAAKKSRFGKPIAHGMLTGSFFSALITQSFGSGALYLEQNLKFLAPVYMNSDLKCRITILGIIPKKNNSVLYKLQTDGFVGDKQVIQGSAVIMCDSE